MGARSDAINAASKALVDTNFRQWGTRTVALKVVKAMEEAGFRIIRMAPREPRQSDGSVAPE